MMNPLNQLPIDPALVRRIDEVAATLARETGHVVFLVVAKDDGKMHVALEVPDEASVVGQHAKRDPPGFIAHLAVMLHLNEAIERTEPKQ